LQYTIRSVGGVKVNGFTIPGFHNFHQKWVFELAGVRGTHPVTFVFYSIFDLKTRDIFHKTSLGISLSWPCPNLKR
jgi:hypothetical protein